MARWLGVKPDWLAQEARAGRVPSVCAGDGFLFHVTSVEKVLVSRAKSNDGKHVAKGVNDGA